MLKESKLVSILKRLNAVFWRVTNVPYAAYGDPAYPLCPELFPPFSGAVTAAEQLFNTNMSGSRITVEWGFGRAQLNWPYLQHFARLKVLEGVGTQRHINNGVLLTNMLNILYGGQCPKYFDCRVGYTLEEYLQLN